MSKYEHQESKGRDSHDDCARFQHVCSIIQPFLRDPTSRILEIGCANGGLLALLIQHGFTDLLGVDPSPASASVARKLHNIRVLTATLSNMPLAGQLFDFIILAGVLEHVRDLDPVVIRLRNLLAPLGQLYISVPDASRYAAGEDAPFQEFSIEHINFFGPKSLENLFHARGFTLQYYAQELMRVGHRTSTSVIHTIFQKATPAASQPVLVRDEATALGLAAYIEASQQVDAQIQEIMKTLATSRQPIIVWGTGAHTLRLLATSRLKDAVITAFVDSNPIYQSKGLNGIRIIAPSDLRGRTEPILISSRAYQEDIARQVRDDLKLPNRLIRLYQLDILREELL
ncbi:MAG: class I SAM-dependent methyltransferase [Kiritimatiellaeota bacterium]|nr:class I SAM-dependent methyltransferase [Kiritimatiellota bacterium]